MAGSETEEEEDYWSDRPENGLVLAADNYQVVGRVGCGAFGAVYKAKCVKTGAFVAVKRIELRASGRRGPRLPLLEAFREISALSNVQHENVVTLLGTRYSADSATLVMEFARSNLALVIADACRPRHVDVIKFYFKPVFSALAHLHGLHIMHRDIKPENILVDRWNRVKLADFGQACLYFADQSDRVYGHEVGTRWYRAPELLFGATRYTPAVDVWATGCVLGEFLLGSPVFAGLTDVEQLARVFRLLGTPTDESWPGWRALPDSAKLQFEPRPPVKDAQWRQLVSSWRPEEDRGRCLQLLRDTLRLDPSARPLAADCLDGALLASGVPQDLKDYRAPARPPCAPLAARRGRRLQSEDEPASRQGSQLQPKRLTGRRWTVDL